MHLRGRYGHGGRLGYDREWRAEPRRSGGGELIDQGMHLLDLTHWLAGPLPLHSALLRTHFWDTPVEDNAALILGDAATRSSALGDAPRHLDRVEEPVLDRGVLPHAPSSRSTGWCAPTAPSVCGSTGWAPSWDRPSWRSARYGDEDLSWAARVGALRRGDLRRRPLLGEPRRRRATRGRGRSRPTPRSPPYAARYARARRAAAMCRAAAADLHPGRGSRHAPRLHVRDTPKPLLEVAGEPFFLHQLRLLARHGAREVVLCVGYLGEQIDGGSAPSASASRSSYSYDGPARSARSGPIRQAARRSWATLPRPLRRYLSADRLCGRPRPTGRRAACRR